jgi:sirohydrochlorin ferrochelatase
MGVASSGSHAEGDRAKGRKGLIPFQHISAAGKILYTDDMHDVKSASPGTARRPKTALLLIAHGSRQAEANADLDHVAAEMRRRGPYDIVEVSFLELAEPSGEQAGGRCVARGAERVILLPYFLSAGVHVRRDLSAICSRLAGRFPDVAFRLAEPVGRHPLMLDILADRAKLAEEEWEMED